MRLPTLTWWLPMRPDIGASTRVKLRLSLADAIGGLATSASAEAESISCWRSSKVALRDEIALLQLVGARQLLLGEIHRALAPN